MKNVFISFTKDDRDKMAYLFSILESISGITPHVVERKESDEALALSALVESGIAESNYFIPIITSNSQYTQWVNQEIGYAQATEGVKILPLVETEIKGDLKGFIHSQLQLTHRYRKGDEAHFKEACISLAKVIEASTSTKKNRETKEEMMRRKDVMPYFEYGYSIMGPPLIPANNRTATVFFKNTGEGQGSVFKIEGFQALGDSLTPKKENFPTPMRIDVDGNIEVPMEILKHISPHNFQVLISFFDKYDNRYHQIAGYKEREKIMSGPVLVQLAD